MALLKSSVLTQASGSVGGLTYSHNRSGMYMRARATPVNPSSPYQQVIREAQSQLSQQWQTILTAEQREGWATYAANVLRVNRVGDAINIGGLPMFVRCNVPRIQAAKTVILNAPSIYTIGNPPDMSLSLTDTPSDALEISIGNGGLTATDWILVYLSRPISPSINFWQGPTRFAVAADGTQSVVVVNRSSFPFDWPDGVQGRVRARISYTDGRLSDVSEARIDVNWP